MPAAYDLWGFHLPLIFLLVSLANVATVLSWRISVVEAVYQPQVSQDVAIKIILEQHNPPYLLIAQKNLSLFHKVKPCDSPPGLS